MSYVVEMAQCTGCGACLVACPVGAISMDEEPDGFAHAKIDDELCVHCGRCQRACPVLTPPVLRGQEAVYAVQSPSREVLLRSASGGAFFELAKTFLREGGMVYGAAMGVAHSRARIAHEGVGSEAGLARLQGSKYATSMAYPTFAEVEARLKAGGQVLFAGMPCQVAGLYGYLGRDYDTLTTVDVFCHGNTSVRHLNLYLAYLAKKHRSEIVGYTFRDKERGVGYKPTYVLANGRTIHDTAMQEAYWYFFQYSKFFRESCHSCPYACGRRVGDLSVGDFWGIEGTRPELLAPNGGPLDPSCGISVVLANTSKGEALVQGSDLVREEATLDEVLPGGEAVRTPQPMPTDRDLVLSMFREGDYRRIKRYGVRQMGLYYFIDLIYDTTPVQALRRVLGRA